MLTRSVMLALLALPGLAACAPTQVYVVHRTVVGLDAATNLQQTNGHIILGYDRNFATIVPKSVPAENGGKETMAVLSCSELEVSGIYLTGFTEHLATGQAARDFAKNLGDDTKTKGFFSCFKGN